MAKQLLGKEVTAALNEKIKAYERTAGLYYPAAISELVESVSDRDFMDDAAAIMGQEIMLEKVEQDAVVF